MGCKGFDRRLDKRHMIRMARQWARVTGKRQQVYWVESYKGRLYDFEEAGKERENVIRIV